MNATTPAQTIQPRYLDVKSTAIYLSRTPGAVYELVAKRQIPFRRRGKKLIFDRQELDEYVHGLEGVDVVEAVGRTLNGGTIKELAK